MDEAEKEIIKNWEENEKTIEGLKEQAATIGMTEAQVTLYKLALKDATVEQIASASATLADIEKKTQLKQILEDIRSPYQDYQDKIATANALLAEGSLSIEEYTLYMAKMAGEMEKVAEDGKDQFAELKQAIEGWGRDSAEAMAEFCVSGKTNFSDMVNSIIKDLLKMSFYQNISPIFSGISGWISGIGGGSSGGFTSSAYSSFGSSFSFLGPGRAGGGSVSPGKMYEVNEMGVPELLNVGNRQFLMMGNQNGYVEAFKASAGGSTRQGAGGSGAGDNYTIINISAVDSQSFADAVKRNPASIVNVVNGSLKNNSYGLSSTMKRTR
jgi:phage-related minor tail protein